MTHYIFGGIVAGYFLKPYIDSFLKVLNNAWKQIGAQPAKQIKKPVVSCMNEKQIVKPLAKVK
jgi:hypothetical protein